MEIIEVDTENSNITELARIFQDRFTVEDIKTMIAANELADWVEHVADDCEAELSIETIEGATALITYALPA